MENLSNFERHLAVLFLWIPFFVLALICKLAFWAQFAYRQNPTISHIPGPRWAAWSRLWLVKTLASGNSARIFVSVNKRYGSIARIGPKNIITSDPKLIRRILAVRSGYSRGPWFDSIKIDPHIPNIVSQRDEKKHSHLRYKLSPSYAVKNVERMEPLIDELLVDWLRRVRCKWVSSPEKYKEFDIGQRIEFLTVDIITRIGLGKQLGCVEADSDKYEFLSTVQRGNAICQHFSVLLEFNTLMYYLTKLPFVGSWITPNARDKSGVGRIMGIVRSAVEQRLELGTGPERSMVDQLLERGIPERHVDAELVIALVAGSDTTSTSVQSTLLTIIANPRVYGMLKKEIREAVTNKRASYPITHDEARKLPYLQACILEGLRKHPPLSQLRERVVPPEGDVIGGHRIPGGTFIGLNSWGTQLDEVFGDDPEAFRPERWFTQDQEQLRAMYDTHQLIFGHGSTKCLGMPMAMMELNKMIFELLRNFDITIANPYQPWTSVCHGIFSQKDFKVFLTEPAS